MAWIPGPPYSIPVTFKRFKNGALTRITRNTAWQGRNDRFNGDIQSLDVKQSEADRLSEIIFVDTKPGRRATGRDGLYADILTALSHHGRVR